jgi:hypothetical protein
VQISKLEASAEGAMHHKSRARVFSQLALVRKQQLGDARKNLNASCGQATEAGYLRKLCLLKDEYMGIKITTSHFPDDNLQDLYTWSKMVTGAIAAEQDFHSVWGRHAAEQSSLTPNSPSVYAAEKYLEAVISETKQLIRSSAQEHLTRKLKRENSKENALVKAVIASLMKVCNKSSSISSVVRELASASLIVAQDRLEKAENINIKFPEIDSADCLKLLNDATEEMSQTSQGR